MPSRQDPYLIGRQLHRFFLDQQDMWGFTETDFQYFRFCPLEEADPVEARWNPKWRTNTTSLVKSRDWWRREMKKLHGNEVQRREELVQQMVHQAREREDAVDHDDMPPRSALEYWANTRLQTRSSTRWRRLKTLALQLPPTVTKFWLRVVYRAYHNKPDDFEERQPPRVPPNSPVYHAGHPAHGIRGHRRR